MRIGITGASGFVGEGLVRRHLNSGDTVRILGRSHVKSGDLVSEGAIFFPGDLCDPDIDLPPFLSDLDVLYHCAGELFDESRMQELHVGGAERLIDASAGKIGAWIQLSSVGAYGPLRDQVVDESCPTNPVGVYERTKTQADERVANAISQGKFRGAIVRPCKILGRRMPDRSILQLANLVRRRLFFYIGAPGARLNYIPVENVVEALLVCGENSGDLPEIYNVCQNLEIEDFMSILCEAIDCPSPGIRVPLQVAKLVAGTAGRLPGFPLTPGRIDGLTNRTVYASTKIETNLGFRHPVSLPGALERVIGQWKQDGSIR